MINGHNFSDYQSDVDNHNDSPTTEIRYYIEAPINRKYVNESEPELLNPKEARNILYITAGLILLIVSAALLSDLW